MPQAPIAVWLELARSGESSLMLRSGVHQGCIVSVAGSAMGGAGQLTGAVSISLMPMSLETVRRERCLLTRITPNDPSKSPARISLG